MEQTPTLRASRARSTPEHEPADRGGAMWRGLRAVLGRYAARNERLQVQETLSLGGRRSIALIECDGKRFLAGMSASGVETIVPVDSAAIAGDLR